MTSRHEGGRRIETPHLGVAYRPAPPPDYYARSFVPAGWTREGPLRHTREPGS